MGRFRVSEPCGEDWDRMEPRAGGRHCARCEHVVVDLSETTLARAEAIARARGGELCVRLEVDDDGEAVFRAPPLVPLRRAARGLALALMVAGCEPSSEAACATPVTMESPLGPPAEDLEPPMLPVGQHAPVAPIATNVAVRSENVSDEISAETTALDDAGPAEPTADQVARTRRKRTRHQVMGRMPRW